MNEIKNGNVEFNGIIINYFDTLTDVLKKTVNIEKEIQNRNNHQFLFISNCIFCNLFTNSCFIFSEIGKLEKIILSFPMGDERNKDKNIFKTFLKKSHIKDGYCFKGGVIQLMYEPHFLEYSLEIKYNPGANINSNL